MSMFVEDNETVEVKIHYAEKGRKIEMFEQPQEGATTLTVVFRQPDFAISQRLVASSTVIDANGNPAVNLLILQNNMLYFLAKSWDAKEPATKDADGNVVPGKPIELNNENIGRLRVELAMGLITRLSQEVGQIM
jgi:hypothetical protein